MQTHMRTQDDDLPECLMVRFSSSPFSTFVFGKTLGAMNHDSCMLQFVGLLTLHSLSYAICFMQCLEWLLNYVPWYPELPGDSSVSHFFCMGTWIDKLLCTWH